MKRLHISKRFFIYVILLILVISLSITSSVLAKYAHTAKNDVIPVTAKAFYFESNYLTTDNHTYKLNNGENSVSIELYNYENDLRISEVDCTYTVTVTSEDSTFTINGETVTQTVIEVEAGQTLTQINLANLKDGYSYKVSATANGGYTKTLSATFEVAPERSGFYMNVDSSDDNYVILTVWTENVTGTVNITFPENLIPDSTDSVMAGITNYQNNAYVAGSFDDAENFTQGYSSHSYRFFKTASYTGGNFTVKIGNQEAENKAI